MQQFAKVLPNDLEARKAFVQSGSLQKLQEAAWGLGLALEFIFSAYLLACFLCVGCVNQVEAESGSKLRDPWRRSTRCTTGVDG